MSIITISSNSRRISEEIGKRSAAILEYQIFGQEPLVTETSEAYGIPGEDLARALSDSSSLRGISSNKRKEFLACLQARFAHFLLADNIVYTGSIGHLLIQGVSHVIKVYVAESIEEEARRSMDEEQISFDKAMKIIRRRKKNHGKWIKDTLGVDDPALSSFDLMIELDKVDAEKACQLIVETAGKRRFKAMTYSRNQMADHELAYRVRALLVDLNPDIRVRSKNGEVTVHTKAHGKVRERCLKVIRERVKDSDGVVELKVSVREDLFRRMEKGMR
jgi:cytidylate kinase